MLGIRLQCGAALRRAGEGTRPYVIYFGVGSLLGHPEPSAQSLATTAQSLLFTNSPSLRIGTGVGRRMPWVVRHWSRSGSRRPR